jgi:hypothetical protein
MFSSSTLRAVLPAFAIPFWLGGVAWRYDHLFYAHPMTQYIYSDMQGYYESALRYVTPGFVPSIADTIYPPGTGYFFGLMHKLDPSWVAAQWALFTLSCAVPLILGWIASTLFGIRVASLTVILASVYFPFVDFFGFFLSEALFIPAMVGALALLILALRARHRVVAVLPAVASGTMFGLAASVKTVALASAALLVLVLVWWQWRGRLRGLYRIAGVMVLGTSAVLFAVSQRCTRANEGHFCLVSNNGPVAAIFGHTAWVRAITWRDSARGITLGWGCPVSAQRRMFDRDITFDFGAYDSKANTRKLVEIVRKDPLGSLALSFDQVCNLFYGSIPWPSSHTKWGQVALESEQLFLLICTLPALLHLRTRVGSVLRLNPTAAPEILLCLPILGVVMTCFVTQGDPRYRIPFDGFIMVLASAEILSWLGIRDEVSRFPNFTNPIAAGGRQVEGFADDVQGPALDLLENPADVLAKNSDHEKLCAGEERHDDDDGGPASHRPL